MFTGHLSPCHHLSPLGLPSLTSSSSSFSTPGQPEPIRSNPKRPDLRLPTSDLFGVVWCCLVLFGPKEHIGVTSIGRVAQRPNAQLHGRMSYASPIFPFDSDE